MIVGSWRRVALAAVLVAAGAATGGVGQASGPAGITADEHGDHDEHDDHDEHSVATTVAGLAPEGSDAGAAPDHPIAGPQGTVGQFVVECALSHSATDDPIVHPGHAGNSHLHDFFGSLVVDADSTYDELLDGGTSCQQQLDTAAYWAPALLDANGTAVVPLRSVAYYRAGLGVDPATVVTFPPDFKMIAGDADASMPQPTSVVAWTCNAGGTRHPAPPVCPDGANLRLVITFPDCWDGSSIDSDDHRSHVAYNTAGVCPPSHPVSVPQLQFAIDYRHVPDPSGLSLASGPLVTAHSDFWNTWDQDKLEREVRTCINADVVCGISGRGVGG